jgi:hypothetical protein
MSKRIGRLRLQLGGEEWGLDAFRLLPANNPHWAWVAQVGPLTIRWARSSVPGAGGREP